ncbi:MAG: glutathione peroxidase [Bacteroidales bacterium]|nr:glutathione peroxidase [Bacteroidales bacterium]
MKKLLLALFTILSVSVMAQNVYDFTVKDAKGNDFSLGAYKGKVCLIVNTATRCGFTPQYTELEALYEKLSGQGFEILDFPCNQFGQQAPGTMEEIQEFCQLNYNTKFPQFNKIEVNGPNESELYTYLKSKAGFAGFDMNHKIGKILHDMLSKQNADYAKEPSIKWNFTKFLIDKEGNVIKRYEPTHSITEMENDIVALLK